MASSSDPAALAAQLAALQAQMAALTSALAASGAASAAPSKPSGPKKERKSAPKAAKAEPPSEGSAASSASAEKRPVPSAVAGWNEVIKQTLAEMLASGWPAFTDGQGRPQPAGKQTAEGAWVREDSGKPPAYNFAMVYASYVRAQSDPEAAKRAEAYRQKVAKMQADRRSESSSVASGSGASAGAGAAAEKPVSKRGAAAAERWAKMSEEERAAASAALKARLAAGKAKKAEAAAAGGAAAAPPAKPSEEDEAEEDGFADAEEESAPALAGGALVGGAFAVSAQAADADRIFYPWTHEGERYYKNKLGHVLSADTEWVGVWNGSEIQDADPPAYLDGGDVKIVEDDE